MSMTSWQQWLDEETDRCFEELVQIRRHLHMHPELSGGERETSLFLYSLLGDEGCAVQLGPEGNGVWADLPAERASAPRIGLRADIDALRIDDQKPVPYRSQHPGLMHACGHDVHAAIVVGVLRVLRRLSNAEKLPCPVLVRGIFQPAEETCQGAMQMIEAGALDGVAAILGTHVDPTRRIGVIGFRDGIFTASCDQVIFEVHGRGGHAARPHESKDPISAAAHLINALYLHIPRVTDSQEAVVITIGKVSGGHNSNVIPQQVDLEGTIRTLDARVRNSAMEHIRRIAAGVGAVSETEVIVRFGLSAPPVINDRQLNARLRHAAQEVVGESGIDEIPRPSMGSEDFAYYLQKVPGAMVRLGSASDAGAPGLHTPLFDVDEEVIRIAVRILARTVISWFHPDTGGTDATCEDRR